MCIMSSYYKKHSSEPMVQEAFRFPDMGGRESFDKEIDDALITFRNGDSINHKLRKDIIYSYLRYSATPTEYFLLGFHDPRTCRSSMLTNAHKDKVLIRKCGIKMLAPLRDKYVFYKALYEYFMRDVICIAGGIQEAEMFQEFIDKNPDFIVKPLNGKCAEGVNILKGVVSDGDIDGTLKWIRSRYPEGCICESLIKQSSELAQWNETSVNTVRMYTFFDGFAIKHMTPVFRTGRKGSITDNAATGGIFANVDYRTGVLITDGHDEAGKSYEFHPDSGLRFRGYRIPEWNELLNIVSRAHRKLCNHRYIGWDFAYTERGWVLIEGDWARFINEYADLKGRKKEFDKLMTYSFIDKMYE